MRFAVTVLTLLVATVWGCCEEACFLSDPALSPNGRTIVFACAGDLWTVPSAGGLAQRLTGLAGRESRPSFSPDGRWVAFSGEQTGNADVYVVSSDGGAVRQLTFHEADDQVDSWSWDSQTIYFNSDRENNFSEYAIHLAGGTPARLFENYFNTVHGLVIHPLTEEHIFTDTWESLEFASRKRYKGAYNPDLRSWGPVTGVFRNLTEWEGKDFWPTIDRHGRLYYVSDQANGEFNLYCLQEGKPRQLTSFPTSIRQPRVNADGGWVVFEKDYQLYLYDVGKGESRRVPIQVIRSDTLSLERDFEVEGKITAFDVAPDGKKIALISRGRLFTADIKGKLVRELATRPEGRVVEVRWLADSLTLVYSQTVDGWLNWFHITADGKTAEEEITFDQANNRELSLNRDRTQGVFLCGRDRVRLLDLKTWTCRDLLRDELWALESARPQFSPDGQYVAYTAYRNFEQDILLHHLESGKTVNLTHTGVTETDPCWSPDGKYLYFAADRYTPEYPRGDTQPKIYRLPLEKLDQPFRAEAFDKLFQPPDKPAATAEPAAATGSTVPKKDTAPVTPAPATVKLDLADATFRWEQVSPNPGAQRAPFVKIKDETATVLYLSNHDGEPYAVWQTVYKPFEPPKTSKIADSKAGSPQLVEIQDKLYLLSEGNIHELDLEKGKTEKIPLKHTFRRDLGPEFRQMFDEVWANVEENFYDETFHGVDWAAMKARYEAYLPHLGSREDLRTLIRDLLGELNASHLGFRSVGPEEKTFYDLKTNGVGLVFDPADPFRVDRVLRGGPLDKAGKEVRPGDRLVAVNGRPVEPGVSREFYFARPSLDPEMKLTFQRGQERRDVLVHPVSAGVERKLRYDEWIEHNRLFVTERSQNRFLYIHMPDMGPGSLQKFLVELTSRETAYQGLILDLRYNTGGNVHDAVLQFLSQRPYTQWKYRGGRMAPQPPFAPSAGPIVLLVNEQSLSDAEMTAAGFKALGLGPVVGTETYRWLIFTSGKGLVDGSFYRLPAWGCYTLGGHDLELHGVTPDILVQTTFKDRLEGRDPQLDRAISEIEARLKIQAEK